MKHLFVLTTILSALVTHDQGLATPVQCLDATSPSSTLEAVKYSEAVFVGIVLDLSEFKESYLGDTVPTRIAVRVLKSWQDISEDSLVIYTPIDIEDFEPYRFEVDSTYLIFAGYFPWDPELLQTSRCMPTQLYADALGIVALLGPPKWPRHCIAERIVHGQRVCERR